MFVLKNRNAPELPCKIQSFEIVTELLSDVSTLCSLTKKIFTVLTPKTTRITNCTRLQHAATKKKDVASRNKTPAHTINFQTSVGESQMVEKTPVWYILVDHRGYRGLLS